MDGSRSDEPFFSVIVLNWNGRHLLAECLDSVLAQSFRDFEVLVVDNGSTDGSAAFVRERYGERVRLHELPENLGFAGGCNAGIPRSRGTYAILLNNDTEVDPGWLAALADAAARRGDAGMFTPKILNFYRRDEIDNTGHVIYPDGLARGRHRLERDDGRFDAEGEALLPSGCAGVYRRRMLDEIGLLDEEFFAYGEDVDLGLRARWAGWSCVYVPSAIVYHKYSETAGAFSRRKAFLVERNRIFVLVKNFPVREILLSPFWTICRYLVHLRGALTGRGAAGRLAAQVSPGVLVGTVLEADWEGMLALPRLVRQRRAQRGLRRIATSRFRDLLRRHRMGAAEVALKD